MQYRTDLAIENHELIEEARARATGYIKKQQQKDEDICVTEIIITDEQGEIAFGKPKGTYITIEVDGILEQKDKIKERAAHTLAEELKKMIKFDYYLKVLVVVLGNEKAGGAWEMANVSGFNPSVTGVTGMETADLIEKVTSMVHPDVVLIVDSLAARNIDRMSTTIQLCDTGIEPGAGMGNRRKAISEETLGCKVVSIGVPTVIDSRNLIIEAAQATEFADEKKIDKYFKEKELNMIVTSTDIDEIIKDFSDIISNAINITLHPGIYS